MKFSLALVFAAAAAPAAFAELQSRQLENAPACAQPCIQSSIPDGCAPDNAACYCNSAYFQNTYAACIARDCSPNDASVAQDVVLKQYCSQFTGGKA